MIPILLVTLVAAGLRSPGPFEDVCARCATVGEIDVVPDTAEVGRTGEGQVRLDSTRVGGWSLTRTASRWHFVGPGGALLRDRGWSVARAEGSATVAQTDGSDRWLAADKLRHLLLSYAATAFAYAGLRVLDVEAGTALGAATAASIGSGAGKEFSDVAAGRRFSYRDMFWNLLGAGTGFLVLHATR